MVPEEGLLLSGMSTLVEMPPPPPKLVVMVVGVRTCWLAPVG